MTVPLPNKGQQDNSKEVPVLVEACMMYHNHHEWFRQHTDFTSLISFITNHPMHATLSCSLTS